MDSVKTINFPGGSLLIIPDDSPESPRDWDNLGTMVCFHKRYNLGDKHEYRSCDFRNWGELEAQIEKEHKPALILPMYMMDHSGLTISCDPEMFRACDPQGFDWGQIGFIFVSKAKARAEFKATKDRLARVEAALLAEVAAYDQYMRGDVYGYVLKDAEGEETDSCWGFYGDDPVKNGMVDHFPEEIRQHFNVDKRVLV